MRVPRYALTIAGLALLCAAAASASYWLTTLLGTGPSAPGSSFLSYLCADLLSFALVIAPLLAYGSAIRARSLPRRRGVLASLTEAMGRIASGDFEVGDFEIDPSAELPSGSGLEQRALSSLGEMTESLKRMDEMRRDFVSNVSHEIQSPLASIRGFAQILRDEGLGPEQRRGYLEIIERESDRLSRLGDNLLKLSALDSRAQDLARTDFRLDAQLRSVLVAYEPQWAGKGLVVEAELEPIEMRADEELLRQVWGNLLHNAIKFTPPGGCISLSCRAEGGAALVAIADSGIGIAAEDLGSVFDRFFKADRSRSFAEGDGNGLGLSIAQRIIERHGGALLALSEGLGKGAVFKARIPIKGQ